MVNRTDNHTGFKHVSKTSSHKIFYDLAARFVKPKTTKCDFIGGSVS